MNIEQQKQSLCKEIGDFFGRYYEDAEGISVDTGECVYKYSGYTDMLADWVDTLAESQKSGGGNWEKDIIFIYSCFPKKHPVGVRRVDNKGGAAWKVSVDLCNMDYPHGKNVHLGTYKSIVDAVDARRDFLSDIDGVNLNTPEGFDFALEKAKERRITAKNNRKI